MVSNQTKTKSAFTFKYKVDAKKAKWLLKQIEVDLKVGYFDNFKEAKGVMERIAEKLAIIITVQNSNETLNETEYVTLMVNDYVTLSSYNYMPRWYHYSRNK